MLSPLPSGSCHAEVIRSIWTPFAGISRSQGQLAKEARSFRSTFRMTGLGFPRGFSWFSTLPGKMVAPPFDGCGRPLWHWGGFAETAAVGRGRMARRAVPITEIHAGVRGGGGGAGHNGRAPRGWPDRLLTRAARKVYRLLTRAARMTDRLLMRAVRKAVWQQIRGAFPGSAAVPAAHPKCGWGGNAPGPTDCAALHPWLHSGAPLGRGEFRNPVGLAPSGL
jgi:hypothetical protein